ncbi:MAG TPA: phage tail tube protein [Microvirga sp.]|jgi:hypothetical protein|nr:phage tail tube protein [Microvirga sp.]
MAFASGAGIRVAYIAEATYGTTPATPTLKSLRTTDGGMRTNKRTGTSAERQPDRNVRDQFLLGLGASGSYSFELTYATWDDLLEGALFGSWSTNVLKNGVTRKSFTVEETIELGATDSFRRFTGCMVNGFSLDIGAQERVTGSISLLGQKETLATAAITGATYPAMNDNPVSTASANVASMTVGSITPAPRVRRIRFDTTNNLRERPEVGSKFSAEFGEGRFELSGTLECYFESNDLYQAVLDHGSAAISFTVGVDTGEKYTFLIPKAVLGDGDVTAGGNDDDIMVMIPFQGVYDATEACTLKITRAVA